MSLSNYPDSNKKRSNLAEKSETNIGRFMKKYGIHSYDALLRKSLENIEWYWDAVNKDLQLKWFQKYDRVVETGTNSEFKNSRWFINGKCNIISNVIDKNLANRADQIAYIFENELGIVTRVTFKELDNQVNRVATAFKSVGVNRGDVVGIYLPMTPEAIFSILACSKIGAVHSTIFSGFGSHALHERLKGSNTKLLVTSNKMIRKGKQFDLEHNWGKAIEKTSISKVIVVGEPNVKSNNMLVGYNTLLESLSETRCETAVMDSEDPLLILYTSGTTGRPKGTIHVHGGFMIVSAQQTAYVIDMTERDILFWYADIGWITGQTWVVYGSPIVGGTALIYDGALTFPNPYIWCELISKHKVSIFGAAPTAIRHFMNNDELVNNYDLTCLRTLTITGEPIDHKAWQWYDLNVGKLCCPIINLSGGTEIGGAILSSSPLFPPKPCSVGKPLPGFDAAVLDESGNDVNDGYLVIKKPWPSMTRGILNDEQRFIENYWSKYKNCWYHGDIVHIDCDGYWYISGRADDMIKVSGHRIGTAEIEDIIMAHKMVLECLVVGVPDNIEGQAILAYVVLKNNKVNVTTVMQEIVGQVENMLGKFCRPKLVRFVKVLPRTNTGKLLRRRIRSKFDSNLTKNR